MTEPLRRSVASVRPLDTSLARDRRVSRGSHSFQSHASTQSWVQSQQHIPPVNDLPSSSSSVLRAVNPDPKEEEHANTQSGDISQTTILPVGLGLHVVNTPPKPKLRFVGGFMTNVKRVFRKGDFLRRKNSSQDRAKQPSNPVPVYIATPPSPTPPSMPAAQPFHISVNQIPEALATGDVLRRRNSPQNPNRVTESVTYQPTEVPVEYTRDSNMPQSAHPSRPHSLHESVQQAPILSPLPSQAQPSALLSPHPSRHSRTPVPSPDPPTSTSHPTSPNNLSTSPNSNPTSPGSHPASIQAHYRLSDDYRRMSLSKRGGTSSEADSSEPSFETELNPIHRFFSTLYNMPWIATERITADYHPGMKRGAWTWKWAKKDGRDKVLVHVPARKPMRPWYTSKSKNTIVEAAGPAKVRDSSDHSLDEPVDLLSSGESAASPLSIISVTSGSRRPRRHHQPHRRRSYIVFSDIGTSQRRITPARESHRRTPRTSSSRRHHKSPQYPHGYKAAPRTPSTPSPTTRRAVSPSPTMTPAFYVLSNQSPQAMPATSTPPPASPTQAQFPSLVPVYMQMLPPAALSDVSSSPGFAGRGAGFSSMTMPVPLPAQ